VIILGLSIAIILLFRRLKLPSILGFIIAGVLIGPHGLSLVQASHEVEIMAELGVIFLLFLIGVEFSLSSLAGIKRTVIIGGGLQVFSTVAVSMFASRLFDIPWNQAVFLGFLFALSSTAIVLKQLQEKGEINSPHGKVTVAVLIFQDIIVVPMMLFTPLLAGKGADAANLVLWLSIKVVLVVAVVFALSRYIVPWLLHQVTRTKSQELFILTIVVICLSTAWLTSAVGLSLALGAFFAGLIISESDYSHQAVGNILPLRELFISFFFVSIGMLLNFRFTLFHLHYIIPLAVAVMLVKFILANLSVLVLGYPIRTSFLTANSIFQVGEFSFLLSTVGVSTGLLSPDLYQYFLSISLITMALTPFAINSGEHLFDETIIPRLPDKIRTLFLRSGTKSDIQFPVNELNDHLVIIGYGINGSNVAIAARGAGIPYVILELDPDRIRLAKKNNEPAIYGDAGEPFILDHIHISKSRVVVIAISDPAAINRILKAIRTFSDTTYIIVRTRHLKEIESTIRNGANEVIPEEFETSIEIFARVLRHYLIPANKIEEFISKIRDTNYEVLRSLIPAEKKMPSFSGSIPNMEIFNIPLTNCGSLISKTIGQQDLRKRYGITIIAIKRDNDFITLIGPDTELMENDVLYLIGRHEDVARFNNAIKCAG
jgi:monovalent cation:H+ antiporter-2, CPA2 family